MWDDFSISDYKNQKFFDVPQLGTRQFGLSLIETVPANAAKKWVPYYHFAIIHNAKEVGYLNFRLSNCTMITEYDGHIGYRIHTQFRGFGFAYRACETVRPLIRQHQMSAVILTCHPDNVASRRTIEKLGVTFLGVKKFDGLPLGMEREKCRYRWVL